MKKLSYSRKVVAGLLLVACLTSATPTYAVPFIGWENDSAFAFTCTQTGGAYTVRQDTLYVFGFPVATRTTYYDSNNTPLPGGDPCAAPQPQ